MTETVIHYIILSSSYSTHARIALHRPYISAIDYSEVGPIVSRIEGCFGGPTVQFGVHIMQTQSEDWESVAEEDPYFIGVRKVDSVDGFIDLIRKDEFLTGNDVARYILKTVPCTQARVNALTYMCYADYLCRTGRRMFGDRILASGHGPAVETVFTGAGEPDDSETVSVSPCRMSLRSRMMFAANGPDMVRSVDATLRKYSRTGTDELVSMICSEGTPWSLTEHSGRSAISDDLIRTYHRIGEPSGGPV